MNKHALSLINCKDERLQEQLLQYKPPEEKQVLTMTNMGTCFISDDGRGQRDLNPVDEESQKNRREFCILDYRLCLFQIRLH
jgi:hypothetical protein